MIRNCALILLLSPVAALAADDVKLLEAGQASSCRLVKQDVCSSTSMDPDEECMGWHRRHAAEAKADAMVLGDRDESRRKRPSLSGMKTITTTRIHADYYDCGLKSETAGQSMHKQHTHGAGYFEQRLKNLQQLKDKGLITEDEYQQKRKAIISEI